MVAEQVINAGKKVAIITDNLTDIELIYSQFLASQGTEINVKAYVRIYIYSIIFIFEL
mgnify:CR=1 FL=1